MRTTIYWNTNHLDPKEIPRVKKKIRDRFNIPAYISINGETTCDIKEEDMELLREVESRGYIQIRNK